MLAFFALLVGGAYLFALSAQAQVVPVDPCEDIFPILNEFDLPPEGCEEENEEETEEEPLVCEEGTIPNEEGTACVSEDTNEEEPTNTPPVDEVDPAPSPSSGSSSSGGGGSKKKPGGIIVRDQGQVLGATTNVPSNIPSCVLFEGYLRLGADNDVESVNKLQTFLNSHMNANLPVTGFFGPSTEDAVKAFQVKYWEEILKPWVPYGLETDHTPTGYVYKTTSRWINILACQSLEIPMPQLP